MIKKLVLFVSLTGVFLCTASCGHKELPSMEAFRELFSPRRMEKSGAYLMIPAYVSLRMYIPPLLTLRDRTVSIIW